MAKNTFWADEYVQKKKSAEEAIRQLRPGQRTFIGSYCGEPQYLVRRLYEMSHRFSDLEIVRLMALESAPLTMVVEASGGHSMNIRSFYLGSAATEDHRKNLRFITPMNLSAIPRLFKSRRMPIHAALIQVTPPDDFGWMSLGVSVDITMAAALSADLVIAQVNSRMPRVLGRSFIHVNDVDVIVEHDEDILTIPDCYPLESARRIARHVARLVDDGSTLQINLGSTSNEILKSLWDKNDLGIHTQYVTTAMMRLAARGVITNRLKGFNDGKLVASSAIGDEHLYEFINDNPGIEFHPSDYVNDPGIISRHNRMTAINATMGMDLTGQTAADALPSNQFSGVNGLTDFIGGATRAEGGKSILILLATYDRGRKSRIVPKLEDMAVVVPRGDVHYVVTEFGAVNLFGKNLQERALAMISIAHPDFRDELFFEAKAMGLLGPEHHLKQSIHGIYPLKLEETRDIDGQPVTIRASKPVDQRRIQEHYYNLEKSDIASRFFCEKTSFYSDEVENISQVDYVTDLTLVAVVGEFGFGNVIAVGEYILDHSRNMAEVAFSVNREWQGKGLGRIFIQKLAHAAQENGIAGLVAYTYPQNKKMIRLFKTLPYRHSTAFEEDLIRLECRFDELK